MLLNEVMRLHARREVERGRVFCPVRARYLEFDECLTCGALDGFRVMDGDGWARCAPQATGPGWSGAWDATPDA